MNRNHLAGCELRTGAVRCLCNAYWLQASLGLGLLVVAIEFAGSAYSGSLALMADGGHTLVDVSYYAVAIYISRRLYARPWEDEHKWEHRASKLNGALFCAVAAGIMAEAVHRGAEGHVNTTLMGWIAFASLVLNIGQYWLVRIGAQDNMINRQVNAHNKADALQSGVVCVAAIPPHWGVGIPAGPVDVGLAAFLAIYFLYHGFEALRGHHHV